VGPKKRGLHGGVVIVGGRRVHQVKVSESLSHCRYDVGRGKGEKEKKKVEGKGKNVL